jgi:hypothetical protein
MGFAASVSSSASSGILFASSAFARGTSPWLAPLAGWLQRRIPASHSASRQSVQSLPAAHGAQPHGHAQSHATPRPLRVLRVVDGASRQCAGRMVISGRMADVCAELDRLVAREAQRSQPALSAHAASARHVAN